MNNQLYTQNFYQSLQEGSRLSAQEVVPLVMELIQPTSVVDVGCGLGTWIAVFRDAGVEEYLA